MSLGNVLRTAAPIAAGYFTGGTGTSLFGLGATGSAIAAGALTGAGIAALSGGDILTSGVMGGLGGYTGGQMGAAFNPAAGVDASVKAGTTTAVTNKAMLSPYTHVGSGISETAAGSQLGMFSNPQAVTPVTNFGGANMSNAVGANTPVGMNTAQTTRMAGNPSIAPQGANIQSGQQIIPGRGTTGLNNKVEGIINDPSKAGGYAGNPAPPERGFSASIKRLGGGDSVMGYGKLGLAGLPVVASAFEPETFTYDQMKEAEAYDPDATLNLLDPELDSGIEDVINEDSGLRLYANQGGMVPTYAEGGTVETRANQGMKDALARNSGVASITSGKGMSDALARNEGIAYTRPTTAPVTATAPSNNIKIAGADNSTSNIGGGSTSNLTNAMGSLNVGSGSIGKSPDKAFRDTKFKMLRGYEVPLDYSPATTGSGSYYIGGYNPPTRASHQYNKSTNKWEKSKPPAYNPFANMSGGGIGNQYGYSYQPFSGYGGPEEGIAQFAEGGMLQGPGDGMSDSLAAQIDGSQPAALSQGEFVVPADVVSHLGNGSSDAGSKRLYAMMDEVRQARTGTEKQGKEINPERYMPA